MRKRKYWIVFRQKIANSNTSWVQCTTNLKNALFNYCVKFSIIVLHFRELKVYAPSDKQPNLDRNLDELSDEEKKIYSYFTHQDKVDSLIKFLSLEEKKGKDKFDGRRFQMFKVGWRIFHVIFIFWLLANHEMLLND